jgi:hypothetical protein
MNRLLLLGLALVLSGPVCFGQTNSPAAATPTPARPALRLPAEPKQGEPASSLQASNNPFSGRLIAARSSADTGAITRIEGKSLMQPRGPIYDIDLERAAAFKPEIKHLGRAQVYSSIGTAVARKNPLCLLDPNFLDVSW